METTQEKSSRKLQVQGMHCAACVSRVESSLKEVPGVRSANVHLASGNVLIDASDEATDEALDEAIRKAGYEPVHGKSSGHEHGHGSDSDHTPRNRVLLAGPIAAILFVLSMFVGEFPYKPLILWALATPVVFWSGWPIFVSAFKAARHGASNMDTLVGLGVATAYFSSVASIMLPNIVQRELVFFEAAAMTVFFVMTGRWLESRAKQRTGSAVDALMDLQPPTAQRWDNGTETEVPVEELNVDDLIRLRPGDRIPVDGTVHEGNSAVDESMVTGESVPVEKGEGDDVIAGTMNTSGSMLVRVARVGEGTVLQQIADAVERAQASKAPIARLADQVAAVFVPIVIAIAAITFIAWMWVNPDGRGLEYAIACSVTVLVISCPCALGLATPTAMTTAMGRLAEFGLLIKDAATIEEAARITNIVFDKTGTLTTGKLELVGLHTVGDHSEEKVLRWATAVEQHSEHPIARAIVEEFRDRHQPQQESNAMSLQMVDAPNVSLPKGSNFESHSGKGATAHVDGQRVDVGNGSWMNEIGVDTSALEATVSEADQRGQTTVFIAVDKSLVGAATVADSIKSDAKESVAGIHELGIDVRLLSGDRKTTAKTIADELGIENVDAEVLPEEKSQHIERLQGPDKVVAMVGDGVNDAPALAKADVGIALSSGTDVAMSAAGMTLLSNDVSPIVRGLKLTRETMHVVRQNLFFAFIYNIIGIPFATGMFSSMTGWLLPPMFAAAAMSMSSLSVVLNSLRLRSK